VLSRDTLTSQSAASPIGNQVRFLPQSQQASRESLQTTKVTHLRSSSLAPSDPMQSTAPIYAFQQKIDQENASISNYVDSESNSEMMKLDNHYRKIIEAERQSFELILQRKVNVA
jgi:hypothetical protein